MFSAISVIATLTRSGNAVAPTGWIWLLFFTAVPLLSEFFGGTPDTYHTAGLERGTATSSSTSRDNLHVSAGPGHTNNPRKPRKTAMSKKRQDWPMGTRG